MFSIRRIWAAPQSKTLARSLVLGRAASTQIVDPIVLTDDGSTFVCWHPEKPYPYEMTRPMPKVTVEPPSVLRTTDLSAVMKKPKDLHVIDELAKETHTTKHRWFPKSSKYRRRQHINATTIHPKVTDRRM